MFRGLTVEVRKRRLGSCSTPGIRRRRPVRHPGAATRGDRVPGRGLFVDGADVTPVQIAWSRDEDGCRAAVTPGAAG